MSIYRWEPNGAWMEGNWFLVLPKVRPGDQIQTPFGLKTIGPKAAGMPESAVGQFQMPDIAALKKMYADGSKQIPIASESTAPRAKRSIVSYSLVQTQSKTPQEFIVSPKGRSIRIVPDAVDGWVYVVQQQNGGTHFVGWASDGGHRKLARLVVVFVDGEANHERHTVLKRPDVARFFKVPLIVARRIPSRNARFRLRSRPRTCCASLRDLTD